LKYQYTICALPKLVYSKWCNEHLQVRQYILSPLSLSFVQNYNVKSTLSHDKMLCQYCTNNTFQSSRALPQSHGIFYAGDHNEISH